MNIMKNMKVVLILCGVVLYLLGTAVLYTVSEYEKVIIVRLGTPVKTVDNAGLNVKLPFIDNVVRYPKMLIEYDFPTAEILTKDKKTMLVDNYSVWRIVDSKKFLETCQTLASAQARLDDIIYSVTREVLGKYNFNEIISEIKIPDPQAAQTTKAAIASLNKREEISDEITLTSKEKLLVMGIEVIDVKIRTTNLPEQNEKSVYERMRTERQQIADKYMAEGKEIATKIRSEADARKTIILAEAYSSAQSAKGAGDADAIKIYNDAYSKDKEFYFYMKSLGTIEKTTRSDDIIILSTDNSLYKIIK